MNANYILKSAPRIKKNIICLLNKEERKLERKLKGQKLDQHKNKMVVEEQLMATSA